MIGFDAGTYNLVIARRDSKDFVFKREINAFIEIPLENQFVYNMMEKTGVKLIKRDKIAYALGEAAVNMAYTMQGIPLKRPMSEGCLNPREKDAMQILKIMAHNLIGNIEKDGELLYYSVPANAINDETDADYHSQILEAIFKSYKSEDGHKVVPRPINEGMALVYAELGNKAYTGFGISCGAGMINVAFSIYGAEVFSFSIVNSGDWIDKMAAKATGESPTYINKKKMDVDLGKDPTDMVERAIQTQYKLMIMNTVKNIKKGLTEAGKKARTEHPADIILAGGTSSPNGFDKMFKEIVDEAKLPVDIGKVIRPKEPLYSVAKGCLVAAENAAQ
jgi:actin-like ATPase involved in cell morphogenesis